MAQKKTTGKRRRWKKVDTVQRTETAGANCTGASGGTKWQADKHTEPRLEHPGKSLQAGNKATRTGTSVGHKPWTGASGDEASGMERPGLQKEKEEAAARKAGGQSRRKMNKSKEQMGEETKDMNHDERREGDEGAAQKESTCKARRRMKLGTVPRTETAGAEVASGQAHGAWTRTSREERTGRQQGHPNWNNRGAEALDWNTRGRSQWNGASVAAQ